MLDSAKVLIICQDLLVSFFLFDYSILCRGKLNNIKGTPPLFPQFSDLKDGKADRIEIFTTDRIPKMMRHMFEGEIL